jgi:isoprenylcysteine carboxyl methyltransferase (ICMT) family protein YpbQ
LAARWPRGQEGRKGATRIGPRSFWPVTWACAIAANVMLYLAPHIVPAAAIRPGADAFAAGVALLAAGIGLRAWAFKTLGRYFTFTVMVSSDQPVITSGPYRLLRHPSYTGILLASAGVGPASANWVGLAAMTLLPLAVILWRIPVGGERAAGHARRPVSLPRRAAPAPRPTGPVTGPGSARGRDIQMRPGGPGA